MLCKKKNNINITQSAQVNSFFSLLIIRLRLVVILFRIISNIYFIFIHFDSPKSVKSQNKWWVEISN